MKASRSLTLLSLVSGLLISPLNGQIVLNYNNISGDYSIIGSEPGRGEGISRSLVSSYTNYGWAWDPLSLDRFSSTANTRAARRLIGAIVDDNGIQGTVNGTRFAFATPFISTRVFRASRAVAPARAGFGANFNFSQPPEGEVILDSRSGTINPGEWEVGNGTFIGEPYAQFRTPFSPTNSTFQINVIPEPSSLGLLGLSSMMFLTRRRRA